MSVHELNLMQWALELAKFEGAHNAYGGLEKQKMRLLDRDHG